MTITEAKKYIKEHEIKYILAQFVDIHGVAKTKAVLSAHLETILDPGAEAAEGFQDQLGTMTPTIADLLSARQLEVVVQFLAGQGG